MDAQKMRLALGAAIRGEVAEQRRDLKEVAEAAGLDRVSLWRYIEGKRAMPLDALLAVAEALNVPAAHLIQRAEDRARRDADNLG